MRLKNTILFFAIAGVIFVLSSCAKTVATTPIQFQKQLLSGTGTYQNTQHTWQLDSTHVNGVNFALTTLQKNFKKTYTFDGGYSDTDNYSGKWEITTLGKLKETFIYKTTNKQDSTVYDIVSISSVQLSLSKKATSGQVVSYAFKIAN
jgi:hypothetical protein